MNVAVEFDQISEHQQRALDAFDQAKLCSRRGHHADQTMVLSLPLKLIRVASLLETFGKQRGLPYVAKKLERVPAECFLTSTGHGVVKDSQPPLLDFIRKRSIFYRNFPD